MFKRNRTLVVLLVGLSLPLLSHADTIVTWTIENANFTDGSLTGSFTLDWTSPSLPLVTAVNITSTSTTNGSFFFSSNSYQFNSNDFYALVPLQNNVDCSGALPAVACPYVQVYGFNTNSLQTGTPTVTLLDVAFATNLPLTGGIVSMLVSHDSPIAGGSPPSTSCVANIQCTSEEAFAGPGQKIPPSGTVNEYRGLLDPPQGPFLVGTVVPLPPSCLFFVSGVLGLLTQVRRRTAA